MNASLSLRPDPGTRAGRFAGYASVFGVRDSQDDIVDRGAFVEATKRAGRGVKLLWQHDTAQPIGRILHLKEDAVGLYVEGQLLLNLARGREAYDLLKAGEVTGLSIGFTPKRWRHDEATGVRHLQSVRLWEISLVTFPANGSAGVTVVKHILKPGPLRMDAIEAIRLSEALERARAALHLFKNH